jgi:hypothetical protein
MLMEGLLALKNQVVAAAGRFETSDASTDT